MKQITPFLTAKGNAREMMEFYNNLFNDCQIKSIIEYKDMPMANDGDVMNGILEIKNQEIMFMDMKEEYFSGYNHSFSFLINCESEEEFYKYFEELKIDGSVMMGPEPVLHIDLVTWVTDRYGVTWQLEWTK